MNIKALGLYIILLPISINGVQVGVNNTSSKKVDVAFSFLVKKTVSLATIIRGNFITGPEKFQKWEEKLPEEDETGCRTYLTSCSINGKDTSFGEEFEGNAWYIDIETKPHGTFATVIKYLDCYLDQGRSSGGSAIPNLVQLLTHRTNPELVHSPRRRTQLYVKLPE